MASIILNLRGKINYLVEIIQYYKDWQNIIINRIFGGRIYKSELRNGLTIIGGNKSNISDLIYEIIVKNIYTPGFLKLKKGDVVMDIGANIGVFSLYAAHSGAGKIFSVEPLQENTKLIKKNFKINKFNPPTIINLAITDKIGKRKIYLGDLDSHASLNKKNKSGELFVKTSTLEKIFNDYKIKQIDFLKMDCEGSEGEIIASTKKNIWNKVKKIALEYHDDDSPLSHKEILQKLKKLGYKTRQISSGDKLGYIYAKRI